MDNEEDDEDYKKAIKQRAIELMGNKKEKQPKKQRAKPIYSDEQREKMLERLSLARIKAVSVRSEKKAINQAIKAEMNEEFETKKKKYLSNPPSQGSIKINEKPTKEIKPQPIKENKQNLPTPPVKQQQQPPQRQQTPQQAPPQPPPQQPITPQLIKATYFRPTMKFYNKHGNNYD